MVKIQNVVSMFDEVFEIRSINIPFVAHTVEPNVVNASEAILILTLIRKKWFLNHHSTTQDLTSVQRFIRQQETELERLRSIVIVQAQTIQTTKKGKETKMKCPEGKLTGSFGELFAAGCIQTGADICDTVEEADHQIGTMFSLLQLELNGNICNGCPVMELNGSQCKAFKQYHTSQASKKRTKGNESVYEGWTVKQIAAKLNISQNEVRRRRFAGTLEVPQR